MSFMKNYTYIYKQCRSIYQDMTNTLFYVKTFISSMWTLFHLIVSKLKKSMLCHNVKISYITCLTFAKIVSKTQSANMVLGFLYTLQWNLELSMTPLDPSPLANRRLIQVLHCITTKPELVYQIYGILLTFFPFIPSYLPFVFILLMFSRQRKSCNHFFLDYISSINLFSFNKAINNSVLRCVTYSSGAVEVHTIYQLWSNKNSLVCL